MPHWLMVESPGLRLWQVWSDMGGFREQVGPALPVQDPVDLPLTDPEKARQKWLCFAQLGPLVDFQNLNVGELGLTR